MLKDIWTLLKEARSYRWLTLGMILSGLGTAFTSVAVYAELERAHAPALFFSLAFVGSILPGLVSSYLARRLSTKISLLRLLIGVELVGALALICPAAGIASGNLALLLIAEFAGSFAGGLLYPAYQTIVRRQLKDHQVAASSQLDVISFAVNVFIGQGLGIGLHAVVGTPIYLCFDFVTYLVAIGFIVQSWRIDPEIYRPSTLPEGDSGIREGKWTAQQVRVFWMMPLLALSCTPAMAVVPMLGLEMGREFTWGTIVLSPTLVLLFSRSLGQLMGPFFISRANLDRWLSHSLIVPGCVVGFLLLYGTAFSAKSLGVAALAVCAAHIASNVVYTLANYGFRRGFSERQMTVAASLNYQWTLVSMTAASLVSGLVVQYWGLYAALALGCIGLVAFAMTFSASAKQKTVETAYDL